MIVLCYLSIMRNEVLDSARRVVIPLDATVDMILRGRPVLVDMAM